MQSDDQKHRGGTKHKAVDRLLEAGNPILAIVHLRLQAGVGVTIDNSTFQLVRRMSCVSIRLSTIAAQMWRQSGQRLENSRSLISNFATTTNNHPFPAGRYTPSRSGPR